MNHNYDVQYKDDRTFGERIADDVATFAGSWKFIIFFGIVMGGWIVVNCFYIFNPPFDPYPFILLNLVLSFVAAFQAPLIMMSQNRTEKKQDIAYRAIFRELKELLEQDIIHEQEIKELIQTQNKLLEALHQTVKIGQITSQNIEEVLEHLEDDENSKSEV